MFIKIVHSEKAVYVKYSLLFLFFFLLKCDSFKQIHFLTVQVMIRINYWNNRNEIETNFMVSLKKIMKSFGLQYRKYYEKLFASLSNNFNLPSLFMSQITTRALSFAKFLAKCAPTPPPPPVIKTTLSFTSWKKKEKKLRYLMRQKETIFNERF